MATENNNENGKVIVGRLWKDRKRTFLGLPWSFTKYSFDEERFYLEKGFFNLKEDEVRLYRIMDLELTRRFTQRIFNVGTIHVCSSDHSLGEFDIINVKNPKQVKELLSQTIEIQRDKKRVINRELMSHNCEEDEHDGLLDDIGDME